MRQQKPSIRRLSHTLCLRWLALATSLTLAGTARGMLQESATFQAYSVAWSRGEEAFAAGDYLAAAPHYEAVTRVFPYEPTSRFRWACCLAQQGDVEGALHQLAAAVAFGWEDAEAIESSTLLPPLHGNPRLAECIAAAAACRDEQWVIYPGSHVDSNQPTGVVVLLPGLGCGPRCEVPYWRDAVDELNLILVSLRGTTRVAPMLYGWHRPESKDTDDAAFYDLLAARQQLDECLAAVAATHWVDRAKIVLAGFSQGGGVALGLLRESPESFRGAFVINSLYPTRNHPAWKPPSTGPLPRVLVMAGAFDKLLPRSQQAHQDLSGAGIESRLVELPATGHEYPADFSRHAVAAIEFVLGK